MLCAAASRFLGRLAGASALGVRQTSLTDLPKLGRRGRLARHPGPVYQRALARVRPRGRQRGPGKRQGRDSELTGLTVTEVSISVAALVTELPPLPRVH